MTDHLHDKPADRRELVEKGSRVIVGGNPTPPPPPTGPSASANTPAPPPAPRRIPSTGPNRCDSIQQPNRANSAVTGSPQILRRISR